MLNMTCRLIQRGNSSAVEHRLAKARVAGSNPVSRSIFSRGYKTLSPGSSLDCAKIVLNFSGALSRASIPGLRLSG